MPSLLFRNLKGAFVPGMRRLQIAYGELDTTTLVFPGIKIGSTPDSPGIKIPRLGIAYGELDTTNSNFPE